MRLVRLLRSNVELLRLIEAVFGSLPAMGNLMVMIGFTQLLFCLFGMQVFGGTVEGGADGLRSNFDSFWQSNFCDKEMKSGEKEMSKDFQNLLTAIKTARKHFIKK